MSILSNLVRALLIVACCFVSCALISPRASAQDAAAAPAAGIAGLNQALVEAKAGSSAARQRLAVRRAIRDAEALLAARANTPQRFEVLEFLFRARQQLIALDDDSEHRKALLETCRELVKAPDEMAGLRLEADMLLSQAEAAKQGADNAARANALRPLVARYVDTPEGGKVLRMAMVMALELGDSRVVTDLQEIMEERFGADLEMINFQRDKLGGQVFGAPFAGSFERSDGKMIRFPMDGLGRSTMFVFWSKDNDSVDLIKGLATAVQAEKEKFAGRLEFVSFNLDELPDAGESILRGLGVDWQALRLPGGRKNPIYTAYARSDPKLLTATPTGYTAMIMAGTTRAKETKKGEENVPDYGRMLGSSMAREWTDERYAMQLSSLMAGDFLVIDPEGEGGIDPVMPPELKATTTAGKPQPLVRGADAVPLEVLQAIQDCFIAPPQRYRLTHAEAIANYTKAVELSRKAIAGHASAPDLWIVRNRLITALLGLWKMEAKLAHLEAAITEAKSALAAGYPEGCDLVARFCLAREAVRGPGDPRPALDKLAAGSPSGPALAAASLLALDVADRPGFQRFRKTILESHTEHPMMWTYSAFLLDRHHSYWLFQMPFTAGWSFGRRQSYFLSRGDVEKAHRAVNAELVADDGKPFRIPADLEKEWTMIVFAQPGPYSSKRDDGLPESPERTLQPMLEFASARPAGDVKVMLAQFGGDAAATRAALLASRSKIDCPVLIVPGGLNNPLVHRLGILSEDQKLNSVLLRKDGRIACFVSGLAKQGGRGDFTLGNVVMQEDENAVTAALERGEIEATKEKILALAPPYDETAIDAKGRKLPKPTHSLAHLRARARVYMALKEWDKALADAEEVVKRQMGTDGGMSLRTDELDESEALRDTIRGQRGGS